MLLKQGEINSNQREGQCGHGMILFKILFVLGIRENDGFYLNMQCTVYNYARKHNLNSVNVNVMCTV